MAKTEIRMTGSGGQGVIMGTIILAEAAFEDGKQVVQCQAYGNNYFRPEDYLY